MSKPEPLKGKIDTGCDKVNCDVCRKFAWTEDIRSAVEWFSDKALLSDFDKMVLKEAFEDVMK